MAQPTPAQRMEHVIRTFIQVCNDADAAAIAACFCPKISKRGLRGMESP